MTFVQREEIQGEGVWYYLEFASTLDRDLMDGVETAFCGRGAKSRAHQALKILQQRRSEYRECGRFLP